MEIALVIIAFLLLFLGLLGSVLPALPGPPLSFVGLLLLRFSGYADFSLRFLLVWAGITAAVTIMDNVLPALMTKRFGGSRMAVIGSIVGLVLGVILFPPMGVLLGPFLGALVGELLNNYIQARRGGDTAFNTENNIKALKVAMGSFLAFIIGTGAKIIVVSIMIFYAVKEMLQAL